MMKRYILVAGPNGSGKTTLYQTIDSLKNTRRINLDEIVREFGNWQNSVDMATAGRIAVRRVREYFDKGYDINQETTLCGKTIIKNIEKAKALGYQVEMHFVCADDVNILKDRIAYRVKCGGHGIPEEDIERRYNNSLHALENIVKMSDLSILYDNTKVFNRFAVYKSSKLVYKAEIVPKWFCDNMDQTGFS